MRVRVFGLVAFGFLSTIFAFGNVDVYTKNRPNKPAMEIQDIHIDRYHRKLSHPDMRFAQIREFWFVVPQKYNSDAELEQFETESKGLVEFNKLFAHKLFTESVNKLTPGKRYTVRIFSLSSTITYDDCRDFMKQNKATYAGAPGLALLWQINRAMFPIDKGVVAFGDVDVLITQKGGVERKVLPLVALLRDGIKKEEWIFNVIGKTTFDSDYCLLCFYEE